MSRIAVRRPENDDNRLSCSHLGPADFAVRQCTPDRRLDRRVVPHQFLHSRRNQTRVLPHPLQLARIAQQREHPVADQVRRRLAPANQQHPHHVQQLLLGEPLPLVLRLHEGAQDVVARRATTLRNDLLRMYALNSPDALSAILRSRMLTVGSSRRARCAVQRLNWSRSCEGIPRISAMTMTGSGCATAAMRSNPPGSAMSSSSDAKMLRIRGSSAAMALPPERLVDQRPQPGVVRRVVAEHGQLVIGREASALPPRQVALARIGGKELVVAQDRIHVGVARNHPRVDESTAVDRASLTQGGVSGVRILSRPRSQRVVDRSALPALWQRRRARDDRARAVRRVRKVILVRRFSARRRGQGRAVYVLGVAQKLSFRTGSGRACPKLVFEVQ